MREKIKASKRHIVVDTLGLMVNLLAHSAGIEDSANVPHFLKDIHKRRPWLRPIFTDSGYGVPKLIDKLGKTRKVTLEIVKNPSTLRALNFYHFD